MLNVVEAPGASVVLPKPAARAKPAGSAIEGPRVRVSAPALVTVKVLETGVPAGVLPKLSLPLPLAMTVAPSRTRATGANGTTVATLRLSVIVKGLLAGSLVAKETVPL